MDDCATIKKQYVYMLFTLNVLAEETEVIVPACPLDPVHSCQSQQAYCQA